METNEVQNQQQNSTVEQTQMQHDKVLPIMVVEPTDIVERSGEQLIVARRKNVAESERYRAVWIQPLKFSAVFEPTETQQVFSSAVEEAIESAASEILKAFTEGEVGKKQTVIPLELLSLENVIAKMAETQTSQRLNGDQVGAWYNQSQTKKDAATRYGETEKGKSQQVLLGEKYKSLASNNPGVLPDLANKMMGYISESDLDNPVCRAVVKRLERLTKISVSADEL